MAKSQPRHKSKPVFGPTINYAHVLTVTSFILAGAGAYYGMPPELQSVDLCVARIENTLQQLANTTRAIGSSG